MLKEKGFTLIELMIVVAIIAVLAAIAILNFMSFVAKTKRSEAKYNLEAIHKAEISWFGENDFCSNSFNQIRWRPEVSIYYYTFYPCTTFALLVEKVFQQVIYGTTFEPYL